MKVLSHERYINAEVNLVHIWEDSSLEYDDEGFSIHELYRGLSQRQDFGQRDWELGRSSRLFSVAKKGGASKGTNNTEVFSNKLTKARERKDAAIGSLNVRSKGKFGNDKSVAQGDP